MEMMWTTEIQILNEEMIVGMTIYTKTFNSLECQRDNILGKRGLF